MTTILLTVGVSRQASSMFDVVPRSLWWEGGQSELGGGQGASERKVHIYSRSVGVNSGGTYTHSIFIFIFYFLFLFFLIKGRKCIEDKWQI